MSTRDTDTTKLVTVTGRINEQGELELDGDASIPPGEVHVTFVSTAVVAAPQQNGDDEPSLTPEEIEALMSDGEPSTLGEILESGLFGVWAHMGIEDSVAWVEEVRRKERERRQW